MTRDDDAAAEPEHSVHEAYGPPLTGREAGAAIALGVISLLLAGLLSILLSGLAEEHRLSAPGIGLAAMTEALTMALSTGLAGAVLKPHRLRWIAALASLSLAVIDLVTLAARGDAAVMSIRGLAGAPEGLLLWISIGMIARTQTPERWSAVLLSSLTAGQVAVATAFALFVIPRFGANGGFAVLAVLTLSGIGVALWLPPRYPPLPQVEGETGAPPARGWIALLATLLLASAAAGVAIYLIPLARQAGLSADVGRLAISGSLGAQVVGGGLAILAAGRVRYLTVFAVSTVISLGIYLVYGMASPAWLFIAVSVLGGLVTLFVTPFFVPMTIEADPSRRAAVQSGAAQLLGGALGPLLASRVVGDSDVRGVLYLGGGLLLVGLAVVAGLHFTRPKTEPALEWTGEESAAKS